MSRPTTKAALLHLSDASFNKLLMFIAELDEQQQQQEFPPKYMNRNIRDILGHLHHWQLLFLDWYSVGMQGEKPVMPAAGYTWRTTPQLNSAIQKQYQKIDLSEIILRFEESHRHLHCLIEKHSETELFEKSFYPWTGTTSLAAFLISATSSHYHWALQLIKKARKAN